MPEDGQVRYKILRMSPAMSAADMEDNINECVVRGYEVKHVIWFTPNDDVIFLLYRRERQA